MFDPTEERPIPLSQVRDLAWIPRRRRGAKLNISTPFRWAKDGVAGVRLEVIQLAGTKCTSEAALARFFSRLTEEPRLKATEDAEPATV